MQLQVTGEVLREIGCDMDNVITVYNKCDKYDGDILPYNGIVTSAKTGKGLDELLLKIDDMLSQRMYALDVVLPYSRTNLINTIRENGRVDREEYLPEGIEVKGFVDKKLAYLFASYQKKSD